MVGKTVVLGIAGGIAVYKVPDLISRLRKHGLNIQVVMTKAAAEFVTPLTFHEVSKNQVHQELFSDILHWRVEHIALAKQANLVAIIPATANVIAKCAHGIADDLLTATILAAECGKLIAPAMNSGMYQNPVTQRNLSALQRNGFTIVGPETGELLCGDTGIGRLASIDQLEFQILKQLTKKDLSNEVILVTAGATREAIDPIRLITNRSSGKMGHALAEAACQRGARVLLVTTADYQALDPQLQVYRVNSVTEMRQQVLALAANASVVIKAAAPADYQPEAIAPQKLKKSGANLELRLIPTPDILLELGKTKPINQLLIGFAAETESLELNAKAKLERKHLDLIIGNLVDQPGIGMGAIENQVTIYSKADSVELPILPKRKLADELFDYIVRFKNTGTLSH